MCASLEFDSKLLHFYKEFICLENITQIDKKIEVFEFMVLFGFYAKVFFFFLVFHLQNPNRAQISLSEH